MDVSKLEKQLKIKFNQRYLLEQAFTHSSYVNEHRGKAYQDNERLEFLGDAVLELCVSEFLFEQQQLSEGEMTKLRAAIVCEPALMSFATDLNFGDYLLLGKGEERTGGRNRPAILADAFEAFLGALYIDSGYEKAAAFLQEHVFKKISTGAFSHAMDYKSQLQEFIQKEKNQQIDYQIVEERGPSHEREFVACVLINGAKSGEGTGSSKKEAEQRAAKLTLDQLGQKNLL